MNCATSVLSQPAANRALCHTAVDIRGDSEVQGSVPQTSAKRTKFIQNATTAATSRCCWILGFSWASHLLCRQISFALCVCVCADKALSLNKQHVPSKCCFPQQIHSCPWWYPKYLFIYYWGLYLWLRVTNHEWLFLFMSNGFIQCLVRKFKPAHTFSGQAWFCCYSYANWSL